MYKVGATFLLLLLLGGCLVQPSESAEELGSTKDALFSTQWGGHFQIDDCGGNNVVNPSTGALNCGSGYTQRKANRQTDPESGCGGWDYFCEGPGPSGLVSRTFGGMYQVSDCNTSWVGNPSYSNKLGCAPKYTPYKVGRVKVPEGSQCGATQYACYGEAFTTSGIPFGGEFQVSDNGQGTKVNPLTGAANCPAGYTALKYGRVLTAGDGAPKAGANQYYCTR